MNTFETFTSLNKSTSMMMPQIKQEDFDYDNVRKSYFEELKLIDQTKLLPTKLLWNKQLLYKKILQIKMTKTNNTMYEVITVDGEDWLTLKKPNSNVPLVRILPAEFCFDIIARAHIGTGHGDSEITSSAIESKYVYPKFCVPIVLKYCNVCRKSPSLINIAKLKGFLWYISIVEMKNACNKFKYLLIYIEKCSEYTFIRPLMSKSVDEVALELFKIFLVFGTPKKLYAAKDILNFMYMVVEKLLTLCPVLIMRVLKLRFNKPMLKKNTKSILKALEKWMQETGCDKWELGCHIVQWKINTTLKVITSYNSQKYEWVINVPYDYFFGHQVNVFNYVSSNEVPQYANSKINIEKASPSENRMLKKLKTTEKSAIVDIKKQYTICHVCKKNLLIQYKCQCCKKPVHSGCGTIVSSRPETQIIYIVRCYTCVPK